MPLALTLSQLRESRTKLSRLCCSLLLSWHAAVSTGHAALPITVYTSNTSGNWTAELWRAGVPQVALRVKISCGGGSDASPLPPSHPSSAPGGESSDDATAADHIQTIYMYGLQSCGGRGCRRLHQGQDQLRCRPAPFPPSLPSPALTPGGESSDDATAADHVETYVWSFFCGPKKGHNNFQSLPNRRQKSICYLKLST